MIPAEAVEAAARALSIHTMVDDSPENEKFREAVRNEARLALEAAAPYMLETGKGKGPIVVPVSSKRSDQPLQDSYVIPADAVGAAEEAAHEAFVMWKWSELDHHESREFFTAILEAAAPHMLANETASGMSREEVYADLERVRAVRDGFDPGSTVWLVNQSMAIAYESVLGITDEGATK